MSHAEKTWQWRRWIKADAQDLWLERLKAFGSPPWNIVERPGRSRALLIVFFPNKADAIRLRVLGGKVSSLERREWLNPTPAPPLQIGRRLRIVHEPTLAPEGMLQLLIPHGLAFGSGDHATTATLLRAMVRPRNWNGMKVLDLGTGTGVLALVARLLGARHIVGTDFDPQAIITARQNEALNFPEARIAWHCADVKKLGSARYDLVVANLFSHLLAESSPRISRAVAFGGELWLSGILRSQHEEVVNAYRKQKLRLLATVTRGRWEMQQWRRAS